MRRGAWLAVAVQAGLLAATAPISGFGAEPWHHAASLALVLAAAFALPGPMQRRSFLAIGALVTSFLAIISGFGLLYAKEAIRPAGLQDWLVWWHVAWCWAGAVFFFQHTWVNRVQFGHFMRRSVARAGPALLHIGAYVAVLAFLVVSWTVGKSWFTPGNYLAWGYVTWLVLLLPATILSARRRDHDGAWRWRRVVDLGLVPASFLATLSGIPLIWFGNAVDAAGLKYASKYWHTAPSILFTVLVFIHSVQLWGILRNHWRRA